MTTHDRRETGRTRGGTRYLPGRQEHTHTPFISTAAPSATTMTELRAMTGALASSYTTGENTLNRGGGTYTMTREAPAGGGAEGAQPSVGRLTFAAPSPPLPPQRPETREQVVARTRDEFVAWVREQRESKEEGQRREKK